MLKIGVVGVHDGWSTQQLLAAIASRTGTSVFIDMGRVTIDFRTGRASHGEVDLLEFDGLIVKKIIDVYSPHALDRLEILRYVHDRGVRVFSPPSTMIPLINRLTGTVKLQLGNIPMPPTVVTESVEEACDAVAQFGEAILKPLYTSKARGMLTVSPGPHLAQEIAAFQSQGNPILYVQARVPLPGRDLGVVFIGGRYVATYARVKAEDAWATSTSQGGRYAVHEPTPETLAVAERAAKLFNLDFTCVDVVEASEGPLVFEVSAFGGFRGLQVAYGIDAAGLYADHVLKELTHG